MSLQNSCYIVKGEACCLTATPLNCSACHVKLFSCIADTCFQSAFVADFLPFLIRSNTGVSLSLSCEEKASSVHYCTAEVLHSESL